MNKITYRLMSFIALITMIFINHHAAMALAASNTRKTEQHPVLLFSNMYYVSTTGSDTNTGTNSAPFKTFAKAVSVLQAGDTLQVVAGTYNETLTLSTSGTSAAPITVIGNGAILNMQGLTQNGITISGSYINVSRFEVIGAIDFGIHVTGKNVKVENNILHDNVTKNGVGTCGISTSWGSAVKVKVGGENTIIRNNTIYNNCGEGIAVTRGISVLVENNTAFDNFSVNIYIDNSPYVTVQNNLSYCTDSHLRNGNRATGIALGEESYTGWGAQLHDIIILGNTIKDCRTGIAAYESNVGGTLTNVTIASNAVPSGQIRGVSLQTLVNQNVLVVNNNLFNSIYILQPVGVALTGNTIGSTVPTSTSMPLPTHTLAAPIFTPTYVPTLMPTSTIPAATMITSSSAPASPTITQTSIPPTATSTTLVLPASPTFTSTSVAPTATSALINLSATETTFDDKNNGFVYSLGWQEISKGQAYKHSYKLTTQNGSFVTFVFTGQSFSILYTSGPTFGKINAYVDNIFAGVINENMATSTFQQRWDYPSLLAQGNHTLKLVFVTTNTSNQTSGSIDAIIVGRSS